RPPRAPRLTAAGPGGRPPLPPAGARPLHAGAPGAVLGAAAAAGAVPALRTPLALRPAPAAGAASPPALHAWPRAPRLQCRRLEEKPRCERQPSPPLLRLTSDHSSNSRIVWEHTRGRYTCTQCPYGTASRDEMTLHIEDHRKNPQPGRLDAEMDFGVGLPSFHAKLTPEMESSLYSQL
ncbi:ZN414 protein, partial [Rhinopomastus cyanomelas]|nr:ZN414 protein [Rhinopomastus cyanomelas]